MIFDKNVFQLPTAIIPKLVPPSGLYLRLRVRLEHAQVWRKSRSWDGGWAEICEEIVTENLISDNWLGMRILEILSLHRNKNNNANLNSLQSHLHYFIKSYFFVHLIHRFGCKELWVPVLLQQQILKEGSNLNISIKVSCQLKNLKSTSISIKILHWIPICKFVYLYKFCTLCCL